MTLFLNECLNTNLYLSKTNTHKSNLQTSPDNGANTNKSNWTVVIIYTNNIINNSYSLRQTKNCQHQK